MKLTRLRFKDPQGSLLVVDLREAAGQGGVPPLSDLALVIEAGPRLRVVERGVERSPSVEELEWAFWYLCRAEVYRPAPRDGQGRPYTRGSLHTALGEVHFELPLFRTGNWLRISTGGTELATGKQFDFRFVAMEPA